MDKRFVATSAAEMFENEHPVVRRTRPAPPYPDFHLELMDQIFLQASDFIL